LFIHHTTDCVGFDNHFKLGPPGAFCRARAICQYSIKQMLEVVTIGIWLRYNKCVVTKKKNSKLKRRHFYQTAMIAAIAGILYNSWPLGYVLNPKVSAHGLASELAAVGQPYNWVFIFGDVISGVLIIIVTWLVWRSLREQLNTTWLKLVLASYALFGFFTAVDALLPLRCLPTIQTCPGVSQDHILLVHGIASITAATALFATALTMWHVNKLRDRYNIMNLVMLAWALFGLMSLFFFFVPGPGYLAQHYFITICAAWMALLPVIVSRNISHRKVKAS
jgi:hypothetical protein